MNSDTISAALHHETVRELRERAERAEADLAEAETEIVRWRTAYETMCAQVKEARAKVLSAFFTGLDFGTGATDGGGRS